MMHNKSLVVSKEGVDKYKGMLYEAGYKPYIKDGVADYRCWNRSPRSCRVRGIPGGQLSLLCYYPITMY
jgi:hypothetical protein